MNDIDKFDLKIQELEVLKYQAVKSGDYPLAAKIRDQLDEAKRKKRQLMGAAQIRDQLETKSEKPPAINALSKEDLRLVIEDLKRKGKTERKGDELLTTADMEFRDRKIFTKTPINWDSISSRTYRRLAAEALDKLSGDLSHDNVAAAKQILKRIIG